MNDILLNEILKSTKPEPTNLSPNSDDNSVNDIINSLSVPPQPIELPPVMTLKDEDLDQFIRDNAGQLIVDSLNYVRELKTAMGTNCSPKEIESIAEMIKATSAAIESLNKMSITRQKINSQEKLKIMDNQQKLENKDNDKITFSRDYVFNKLMELHANKKSGESKKIDDPVVDVD